MKLPQILIIH